MAEDETVVPTQTRKESTAASLFSMAALMRPSVTSSGSTTASNSLTNSGTAKTGSGAAEVTSTLSSLASLSPRNLLANFPGLK